MPKYQGSTALSHHLTALPTSIANQSSHHTGGLSYTVHAESGQDLRSSSIWTLALARGERCPFLRHGVMDLVARFKMFIACEHTHLFPQESNHSMRRPCELSRLYRAIKTMSAPPRQSYSAAASSSLPPRPPQTAAQRSNPSRPHPAPGTGDQANDHGGQPVGGRRRQAPKRAPSPHYTPRTTRPESAVYVLTLLTSAAHHRTLTNLRKRYFPAHLNKLDAHITLFHALPGSKLSSSIIPTLEGLAHSTSPFRLNPTTPFRLRKGVGVSIPNDQGGQEARDVHAKLQEAWKGFLSEQDAGGFRAHYTVMNKEDDESKVADAMREVESTWRGCEGVVEGLSLFLYDRGRWVWERDFEFAAEDV